MAAGTRPSLTGLRREAAGCRACPLWACGTQTVFGEGPARAQLMLVGEQPGDQEDRAGRPFVGPAGRLLDNTLAEAGIDRRATYLTNAVKHFKWQARGKRRIHQKPAWGEISSILRAHDTNREREFAALVDDLRVVASTLERS